MDVKQSGQSSLKFSKIKETLQFLNMYDRLPYFSPFSSRFSSPLQHGWAKHGSSQRRMQLIRGCSSLGGLLENLPDDEISPILHCVILQKIRICTTSDGNSACVMLKQAERLSLYRRKFRLMIPDDAYSIGRQRSVTICRPFACPINSAPVSDTLGCSSNGAIIYYKYLFPNETPFSRYWGQPQFVIP